MRSTIPFPKNSEEGSQSCFFLWCGSNGFIFVVYPSRLNLLNFTHALDFLALVNFIRTEFPCFHSCISTPVPSISSPQRPSKSLNFTVTRQTVFLSKKIYVEHIFHHEALAQQGREGNLHVAIKLNYSKSISRVTFSEEEIIFGRSPQPKNLSFNFLSPCLFNR